MKQQRKRKHTRAEQPRFSKAMRVMVAGVCMGSTLHRGNKEMAWKQAERRRTQTQDMWVSDAIRMQHYVFPVAFAKRTRRSKGVIPCYQGSYVKMRKAARMNPMNSNGIHAQLLQSVRERRRTIRFRWY